MKLEQTNKETMTHDEMIAIIAAHKEGKRIEYKLRDEGMDDWDLWRRDADEFDFNQFDYRIAPSPIAKGHNPDSLTEEQVGVAEGWRLLDEDEVFGGPDDDATCPRLTEIQCWSSVRWRQDGPYRGNCKGFTYRTKLTREELAKARGLQPKIAAGYNPLGLTEEQVGVAEGWRLLGEDEIGDEWRRYKDVQYLGGSQDGFNPAGTVPVWTPTSVFDAKRGAPNTLRTKKPPGYYVSKPKPKVQKPLTWKDFIPGRTLIRRKGRDGIGLVVEAQEEGLIIHLHDKLDYYRYDDATFYDDHERSLDGGETWLPCYGEECE